MKHVSAGLFRELLSGMIFCCQKDHKIKIDFPIYLLSGKNDAVGDFGKGIVKTVALMKKQGVENIEYVLFDNMRHDILHEEHRDDSNNISVLFLLCHGLQIYKISIWELFPHRELVAACLRIGLTGP